MKIGILTFSRTHNFGAILQCYALQNIIKSLGNNVSVIEYKQPYIEETNRPFLWKVFYKLAFSPRKELRYLKSIRYRKASEVRFSSFKKKYLFCSQSCNSKSIPRNFDAFIVGSDQVWSFDCTNGYDPVFWGTFKDGNSISFYSYAISTNSKSLKTISKDTLKRSLDNFKNLSFREQSIAEMISKLTPKKVSVNIDPTLLLTRESWNLVTKDKFSREDYVLVYEARKKIGCENNLLNMAKKYAARKGIKIVYLTYDYSPEDFVSLFKYAKYVITSSFHGTVFGLIFNKPMNVVCLDDGHDDRYVDLLNSVGASNALMHIDDDFKENILNYDTINLEMSKLRQASVKYLKEILQ